MTGWNSETCFLQPSWIQGFKRNRIVGWKGDIMDKSLKARAVGRAHCCNHEPKGQSSWNLIPSSERSHFQMATAKPQWKHKWESVSMLLWQRMHLDARWIPMDWAPVWVGSSLCISLQADQLGCITELQTRGAQGFIQLLDLSKSQADFRLKAENHLNLSNGECLPRSYHSEWVM